MRYRTPLVALILPAVLRAAAWALFDVKDPLSKMYGVESQSVYAGTMSEFDAETHVMTVKPFRVYKGAMIDAEALRIQIKGPESLWAQVRVGQPVVLFQGRRSVGFHVADHWYGGQPLGKPQLFLINSRIGREAHTAHDESFPGTTPALVKALDELKAGKSTLLDAVPEKLFPTPVKEAFTLPADATGFAVVESKDAKSPMFVVATAAGMRAFTPEGGTLKDVTPGSGLAGLKPALVAGATIGGRQNLFLDHDVYNLEQDAFHKIGTLQLPAEKILALAADNISEDGQMAVAVLTQKDLLRIPLSTAFTSKFVAATQPQPKLNDPAAGVDDAARLTGSVLTQFHKEHNNGFGDAASMAAVDLNGDHRPDLVILTPGGTLTLVNRGFGGFLVNKDQAAPLLDPAATGKTALPLMASTSDTLWLLQKDGSVYRYNFAKK